MRGEEAGPLRSDSRLRPCWLPGRSRTLSLIPFQVNQPEQPTRPPALSAGLCAGGRRGAEGQLGGRAGQMEAPPAVETGAVGNGERTPVEGGARGELQGVEAVAFGGLPGRPCHSHRRRRASFCVERTPMVTTSHRGDELTLAS